MQVRTRGGIFGSGGYGGGVFDGSMAVGAVGLGAAGRSAGYEQAAAGIGVIARYVQAAAGLGAVPTGWSADSRVSQLQSALNEALTHFNCTTHLTVDGLIGSEQTHQSKTCGALAWADHQSPSPLDIASDIRTACTHYTAVAPSCPAPAPPAPPAPGPTPPPSQFAPTHTNVLGAQTALNPVLYLFGYQPLALDGQLTPQFCGAVYAANLHIAQAHQNAYADIPQQAWTYIQAWLDAWGQFGDVMTGWCQAFPQSQWVTPPAQPGAQPPGPGPSTPEYIDPQTGECILAAGISQPYVADVQRQLNVDLDRAGYQPIPVTGTFDDETCGGIIALKGSFNPVIAAPCTGNGYRINFSCAHAIEPTKKGEVKPPPPKKKMSTAAMAVGGMVAAAAVAGIYFAVKKGS